GLDATYQPIGEQRGNAVGRLPGDGSGPSLLFYGHLDTVFAGVVDEDRPVTGGQERRALRPEAVVENGHIAGLGASNPKGPAVCWEEAGDCWFRVQVHGVVGDVTSRHAEAYKNPIVEAAEVIRELEAWFPEYTVQNTAGQIAPQATIGAVEAGWPFKPTFIPAICNLYLSMRTNPRTDLMSVQRQLDSALDAIRTRHPELDLRCDMYLAVPGQVTDPDNWIVRSCIRGWEAVEGSPHLPRSGLSYAPDSNVLRQ